MHFMWIIRIYYIRIAEYISDREIIYKASIKYDMKLYDVYTNMIIYSSLFIHDEANIFKTFLHYLVAYL